MEAPSEVVTRPRVSARWHRFVRNHSVARARWSRLAEPATAVLLALGVVGAAFAMARYPNYIPFSAYIPFAVLAGLLLTPRNLAAVDFVLVSGGVTAWCAATPGSRS